MAISKKNEIIWRYLVTKKKQNDAYKNFVNLSRKNGNSPAYTRPSDERTKLYFSQVWLNNAEKAHKKATKDFKSYRKSVSKWKKLLKTTRA